MSEQPLTSDQVSVLDLHASDIERRGWFSYDNAIAIDQAKSEGRKLFVKLDDFERLQQRCHPSKVVMIDDARHYVSEAIFTEIDRLRHAITSAMDHLSNGDTEEGARVLRECFWLKVAKP